MLLLWEWRPQAKNILQVGNMPGLVNVFFLVRRELEEEGNEGIVNIKYVMRSKH